MSRLDLDRYDALGQAQLIRTREITPAELLEATIARAEAVNPQLNFISVRNYEEAREQAAAGAPTQGLFAGVPLATKDLGATIRGVRSTNGSRMASDMPPSADTEMIARLRAQGFNFFCTTTSPEMGVTFITESTLHGATRNPWNPGLTPGGSSGGAAALVASGAAPLAHANDGGGSIRVPAACCGLFGLKPTRARSPSGPFGEGWSGLTSDNAVSRTVRDNAAFLDAMAGPEVGAPYWCPPAERPFLAEVGRDPGRLRIALMRHWRGRPVDPDCVTAVEDVAALIKDLGHEVVEDQPAIDLGRMLWAMYLIVGANTRAAIDAIGQMRGRPVAEHEMEPLTQIIARDAAGHRGEDYAVALMTMHAIGRQFAEFMQGYDVILSPTLGRKPVAIGELHFTDPTVSFEEARDRKFAFAPFTGIQNVSGHPAASVPLYWTDAGLPIGVQIGGRFGGEATLFRLAAQLEAARPWSGRRPPVWAGARA